MLKIYIYTHYDIHYTCITTLNMYTGIYYKDHNIKAEKFFKIHKVTYTFHTLFCYSSLVNLGVGLCGDSGWLLVGKGRRVQSLC